MKINASDYTAHLSRGKFEGETPATEYFYHVMLTGDGETVYAYGGDDDQTEDDYADTEAASGALFQVNAEESEAFGLPTGHWFLLREDSQGFAIGTVHATREAAEQRLTEWFAG
jgi:hypothetical protein